MDLIIYEPELNSFVGAKTRVTYRDVHIRQFRPTKSRSRFFELDLDQDADQS